MAIPSSGIQAGVTLVRTNRQRNQRRETPRKEGVMPARKRKRRERTHDWQEIQQATLWPEQEVYERLRPIVLFGETAAERAKETGASERTLHYQARRFELEGMASLFPKQRSDPLTPGLKLPPEMCQLIVNLKAEYPGFSLREISTICAPRVLAASSPTTRSNGCWLMDPSRKVRRGAIRPMPRSPIPTSDVELSSICTLKAGPIRALAPTCKRLAIECMRCSKPGPSTA